MFFSKRKNIRWVDIADDGTFEATLTLKGGTSTSTMTVTTPNGGESWEEGYTHNIQWDADGGGQNVKIQVLKSGSVYKTIKSKTANDGIYSWKVGFKLETPQSDYKIKITSKSNSEIADTSDGNFTLTKFVDLEITSPTAGDNWTIGNTHLIQWNAYSQITRVDVVLYKNGDKKGTIEQWAVNDGDSTWNASCSGSGYCWINDLVTGNDYRIRLIPRQGNPNGEGDTY